MRNITQNLCIAIVFKNFHDTSSFNYLVRQSSPNWRNIVQVFNEHCGQPYFYICLDFRSTTPDWLRLRSNILSDYPTVFANEAEIEQYKDNPLSEYSFEFPEV